MDSVCQPSPVVEPPLAEHRIELGLFLRRPGIGQRRGETLPFDRALGEPLQDFRGLDAEHLGQCRHDVDGMDVRVAHLPAGRDSLPPGHDADVGGPAFVPGEPFPVGERRIEGPRPPVAVVVVGRRAAEFVEVEKVLPDIVRDIVEELHLVEGAVGSPFAACTVVRDDDDDGVLQLVGVFEIIEEPPDSRGPYTRRSRRRPRPCG